MHLAETDVSTPGSMAFLRVKNQLKDTTVSKLLLKLYLFPLGYFLFQLGIRNQYIAVFSLGLIRSIFVLNS